MPLESSLAPGVGRVRLRELHLHRFGEVLYRRCLKQLAQREVYAEDASYSQDELHAEQGVASGEEEVIF